VRKSRERLLDILDAIAAIEAMLAEFEAEE
jgi:hypothetical protein